MLLCQYIGGVLIKRFISFALILIILVACGNNDEFIRDFTKYVESGNFNDAQKLYEKTTEDWSDDKIERMKDDLVIKIEELTDQYSEEVKDDYEKNEKLIDIIEFTRNFDFDSAELEKKFEKYEKNAVEVIGKIDKIKEQEKAERMEQLEKKKEERKKKERKDQEKINKINEEIPTLEIKTNDLRALLSRYGRDKIKEAPESKQKIYTGTELVQQNFIFNDHKISFLIEPVKDEVFLIEINSEYPSGDHVKWGEDYAAILFSVLDGIEDNPDNIDLTLELANEVYRESKKDIGGLNKEIGKASILAVTNQEDIYTTISPLELHNDN